MSARPKKRKAKKRKGRSGSRRPARVGAGPASAVAPHDGPLISLTMMVKDEEEMLEEALESARDWVDEMIVVDTGSTDRTVEIAQDLGATVSHFPWCDSFSLARNETLRRSNGRWNLVLDADERVVAKGDPAELREALSSHWNPYPFPIFLVEVRDVTRDLTLMSSSFNPRILPNDPELGYVGRVHNRLSGLGERKKMLATYCHLFEILHLGYDPELYAERKKAERSLPLIEKEVQDNPDDARQRFHLGREYVRVGRSAEAIEHLLIALDAMASDEQADRSLLETCRWFLLEGRLQSEAAPQETLQDMQRALDAFPENPDLWDVAGRIMLRYGQLDRGIRFLRQALDQLGHETADLQRWQGIAHSPWKVEERIGRAHADLGQVEEAYRWLLKAAEGRPRTGPGWAQLTHSLCVLGLKLEDQERLPELMEHLLGARGAPKDAFWAYVRLNAERDASAGAALLRYAVARHPGLVETHGYEEVAAAVAP